eukprot:Hpha_TRINITY_DN8351_c0_g1::TRINITY_DN8351_c0_g1_i1::g.154192::m.154192
MPEIKAEPDSPRAAPPPQLTLPWISPEELEATLKLMTQSELESAFKKLTPARIAEVPPELVATATKRRDLAHYTTVVQRLRKVEEKPTKNTLTRPAVPLLTRDQLFECAALATQKQRDIVYKEFKFANSGKDDYELPAQLHKSLKDSQKEAIREGNSKNPDPVPNVE